MNDDKKSNKQNNNEQESNEYESNEQERVEEEQQEMSNNKDSITTGVMLAEDYNIEETKPEEPKDDRLEKKQKTKTSSIIIGVTIAFVIIVILLLLFSTIFALITSNKNNIVNGVVIKDIDVSGLTKEEALEKVNNAFNEKLSKEITLKHNDYEQDVFLSQFEIKFDTEKAVNLAYSKGRSGNIFRDNYQILTSMLSGSKINPGFSYNEQAVESLANEMEANFSDRLIQPSYYVNETNLVLTKGQDGIVIDVNELKNKIVYYACDLNEENNEIEIPIINKTANTLDINKIHDEVYRAAKDAYYTTNPYVVYPHENGIDFSISIEEVAKMYEEATDTCTIPLKILYPNVTTNEIGTEAFPNLLATYSTTFSTRNVNRATNIRLATQKINGTVIMPQETFSYNQTVGKRTTSAGFKSAAVYSNGEVTTGIGGGICQVSSTLYNSVLLANLEIVERYNHGFNPGYVPAGRDATVSWGGPDFKFKNSREYPVKIVSSVLGGKITIQIFGLKTENEYDVEIESYITSYIQYKTVQKKDLTLAKGATKVIQSGSNGCRSVCYRILKQNGTVVSKTLISSDTYNPHNKIVAVGTK